jgi:hypothetical protein
MTTAPPGAGNRSGCCHERQCAGPGSCCFSVFSSHFPQPGRPWPRWPCQSSAGRGRPTSIASAPVKSPTSAPSPPACGDRRPASARRAGRCSSGEGFGGYAAVTTARMVWPASQLRRPARLAQVTTAASNQIGVAQMTAQIPVVMQSTGRNCVNVATLARHPGWAPENDTALKVELERPAENGFCSIHLGKAHDRSPTRRIVRIRAPDDTRVSGDDR